jgi:peptidyl-prolyl cis-trans isomerase B (cyclophilin B)
MAKLKVHDIAPDKLKSLTKAVMATDRGDITIEFYPDVAPNTVANFYTLAKDGFYDGLKFHRVIPGFVGSLSMAHAGRDTGGSQFFLVLEPQPHLDNNHTVFGKITDGLEAMHALKQGDKIKSVKFAE